MKIRVPARVWGQEEKLKKLKEGGGGLGKNRRLVLGWRAGKRDQVNEGQRSRERERDRVPIEII